MSADIKTPATGVRSPIDLSQIVTPESVLPNMRVAGKRQALHELSRRAAALLGVPERQIEEILVERERLGSTGVGTGVAIPHGKLPGLDRIVGMFARLDRPIEFDAIDGQPVDLLFLMLAPPGQSAEHLRALAQISRLLRRREICAKLRGTDNRTALYALLTQQPVSDAA